jgi:hypothetical protein
VTVDLGVVTIHVEEFTGIVLEEFAILFRLVHEEMGAIHLDRDISIALNVWRDSFVFEDTSRQVNNRTETLQTGVIIVDKLDHRKNTLVESIETFLLESLRGLDGEDRGRLLLLLLLWVCELKRLSLSSAAEKEEKRQHC